MSLHHLALIEGTERCPTYTYEMWVQDLQGVAWHAFAREGYTIEKMAFAANLHYQTVENFVWGDTKRPTGNTVFQMAAALGFRLPLIASGAGRQPDEFDLSWAGQLLRTEALGKRKRAG